MREPRRIAVMGLYRSGSSAVAGILHYLGVHMGAPYFGDFFESASLAHQLRIWWNERKQPPLQASVPQPERVRLLKKWIEDRERAGAIWVGAKHPLLSLSGDDLLEAWGAQTHFIWCFRPLEESILSLESKRWFANTPWRQRRLWDELHRFFARQPHLRLDFAQTLADPANAVARIVKFLRIEPTNEAIQAAVASIKPEKRTVSTASNGSYRVKRVLTTSFEIGFHRK